MFGNKSKQDVNEWALEYLEQKYGEKFEYAAPAGASYTGARSFLATCESFGERKVLVQVDNYKDENNRVIRDNYMAIKYEQEVKDEFTQIANEEFGDSKVFYAASGRVLAAELSSNMSFEDYLKCSDGLISAIVSLPEKGYKGAEQFTALSDRISSRFGCDELSILIIVVSNAEFEITDEELLRNMFSLKSGVAHSRITRYNGEVKLNIFSEE